jgi:hypothetical protein
MSIVDRQYILLLSSRLERFKKKSDDLYNFRCPHCGDSKKNKSKARGYVYRVKNELFFKCHNCGMGQSLGNLIKYVDPQLYKDYLFEKYKKSSNTTPEPDFNFKPVKFDDTHLKKLKRLDKIPQHPAYDLFIKRRKLEPYADKLYVTWHFIKWVNSIIPNKFPKGVEDHPRIVIPFLDTHGKMFAFQGRSFGKEQPKYYTIKIDSKKKNIFGLDRIDKSKHIYIVEGPLDSLFLPNCVAVAGSDLKINLSKDNSTVIFDNEPRSKEIIDKMYKVIDDGYNICIWPASLKNKDINDMIIHNLSPIEIKTIIDNNTYTKLSALQKLNNWKLC